MENIKISELSIGDWVRYEFPEIGKKSIQVNSIDEEDNHIGAGGVGASAWSDVSDFEPIPLTPEILEKNGWLPPRKAIALDTWWWTNGVDKAIEAYEYEGEWYLTIIEQKEIQYRNRVGIGLKYVHQLQHALRLAGVGKEIEL